MWEKSLSLNAKPEQPFKSRLVIRRERIGRTGRESDAYYFRMFSFLNASSNGCENCARLRKLIADRLRDILNML